MDDAPRRIAVLGAGPIGLEAALYARYLGYDVDVYERGRIAENVLGWGHVRMFSPFAMNCSPLGLAALAAQDPSWRPPDGDALLSGSELVERYHHPLAKCDLLDGSVRLGVETVAISRSRLLKGDLLGDAARADAAFRLLLRRRDGEEFESSADVVIDATGTYGHPNHFGSGGAPAVGETALAHQIEFGLPHILGGARDHYANRRVLLIGAGYSAATSAVALSELASQTSDTRIHWVTRRCPGDAADGPLRRIVEDRLPERDRLASEANRLAKAVEGPLTHYPETTVQRIAWDAASQTFEVQLAGAASERLQVDRVIANVGYRPDARLYAELQVHQCYATDGPINLASALAGAKTADCLDQPHPGPQVLVNPEPDFYILGAKSYGRGSQFLISVGIEQIRDVFTLIGQREDLDLYTTMQGLTP